MERWEIINKTKQGQNSKTEMRMNLFINAIFSLVVFSHSGGCGHDGHRREGDDRVQHCAQVPQGSMINLSREEACGGEGVNNLWCICV